MTKALIRPASAPEVFEVTELEQLRVLADPLRLRILHNLFQQPKTVKQVADQLELPATKLYYHVGELERIGVVKVVETRVKSGIVEKYYKTVAETVKVSRELLRLTGQELEQSAYSELLASIMEAVADDLRHAVHAGLLTPPGDTAPRRTTIGRTNVRLSATAAARFTKKLAKLMEEIKAADDPAGKLEFGAAIAFFPLNDPGQSEALEMAEPQMRDVLRNRSFRNLLIGQFVSQMGDGLIYLSLIIMLNRLFSAGGAAAAIGLLMISQTTPRVIFGLLSGVYVDRLDRKRLMIVSDLARGALVLVCLLVRQPADIWIYCVSAALMAAIGSIFGPAKDASLPHLVKKDQLLIANSLSQTSSIIALTTGSALAGVLMGAFESPVPAIVFDALSFLVSAAFIVTLPIPHHAPRQALDQSARQVWRELTEGLSFVAHQRVLVGTMIGFAITMLGAGATNVLFVPFLVNDLHMKETYLGLIDLTQMTGMVLVNLFIARLAARWTPARIVGVGIIGLGLSIATTGLVHTAWVLFPLSILWGIFLAPVEASASTIIQSVPDRIRGRTLSAVHTVIGTTNVVSMALAGVAGAVIGARSTFIAGGLIAVAGGGLAWLMIRGASAPSATLIHELAPQPIEVTPPDELTAAD